MTLKRIRTQSVLIAAARSDRLKRVATNENQAARKRPSSRGVTTHSFGRRNIVLLPARS